MKFIHFGCWNNGKCSIENNNGLSKMTNLLRKYVSDNDIDFITIAGDNYYPKKGVIEDKKFKMFEMTDFLSGFECLPKDIKKYVLFGNHDIEDIVVDEEKKEYKCKALLLQKNIISGDKSYEIFDDIITKIYNNTLIIMFDTSIYTLLGDDIVNETCYKHIFSSQKIDKIKNLLEYQESKIKDIIIDNNCKNIIFIGHHPIIAKVLKKETNIFKAEDGIIRFFQNIKNLLINKNIFYLCADTHFYQKGIITIDEININQYIVGTGGAEQDDLPKEPMIENYDEIIYNILEQDRSFGFISVNIDDNISIDYLKTNIDGGYYDKYLKYKTKYLKLKNKI
jgi:hypothetical protein